MLREDLAHKKIPEWEENFDVQLILSQLYSLHSVLKIQIGTDDSMELEKYVAAPVKRKPRKKAASAVTSEVAAR